MQRVVECSSVFQSLSDGGKHRCKPPDEPQQPMQRNRQPPEHLKGGVQLDTTLLHQAGHLQEVEAEDGEEASSDMSGSPEFANDMQAMEASEPQTPCRSATASPDRDASEPSIPPLGADGEVNEPPQRPQRGRERRTVLLPEPQLYARHQFTVSDFDGNAYVPHQCPVAMATPGSITCHIVRQGAFTKHGVIGHDFPVAVSGVPRLRCSTHSRSFSMLHPEVYEALPPSVLVRPDLVVLTEDLVLTKGAYQGLAIQALDSGNVGAVASQIRQKYKIAWELFPSQYAQWATATLKDEDLAAVVAEISRWEASGSGDKLDFSSAQAVAAEPGDSNHAEYVASETTEGDAHVEGALQEESAPTVPSGSALRDLAEECISAEDEEDDEQAPGGSTPQTLSQAQSPVSRLRWLLHRVSKSKLSEGIGRESVQKILEHYWVAVGKEKCKLEREKVLALEGQRASADHTYHVVSNLAARDDTGRQRAVKASLTSVMGQDYVLGCKVAPDDSHQPVSELLREIFVDYKCKHFPSIIATDNAGKDQYTMFDTMSELREERIVRGMSDPTIKRTTVVQDMWHGRERIARLLNRGHPDYYPALAELKIVFARLSRKTLQSHAERSKHRTKPLEAYASQQDFVTALDQWCTKWRHLHNDKNESPEAAVLRLAATLSKDDNILQDAIQQHNAYQAQKEEERADAQQTAGRTDGVPQGRLPNLFLGSHGEAALRAHARFESLPMQQQYCDGGASVTDEQLPFIPQRSQAWFVARRGSITASNAALWLGLKEPKMSKALAMQGLKVHAANGHAELMHAFQAMSAPDAPVDEKQVSPFAACAMAMGTWKECDVLLTYAQHMDASQMSSKLKMYEIGAVVLHDIPRGVADGEALQLPRIMASCDAVVRETRNGPAIRIVEAKHRTPFVPASRQKGLFTYTGRSTRPQQQITCEQFAQCQFQMLVLNAAECDLISYSLGSSRIFTITRDNAWLQQALGVLQHMQITYISQSKPPPRDALMYDLPDVHSRFLAATVAAMQRIKRQQHAEVQSAVKQSSMSPYFLDIVSDGDDRKAAVEATLAKCAASPASAPAPPRGSPVPNPGARTGPEDQFPTQPRQEARHTEGASVAAVVPSPQEEVPIEPSSSFEARLQPPQSIHEKGLGKRKRTQTGIMAEYLKDSERPKKFGKTSGPSKAGKSNQRSSGAPLAPVPASSTPAEEAPLVAAVTSAPKVASDGIVTSKVREAAQRIKHPAVLKALWYNTTHPELTQGTSGNENWHSWLKATIPVLGGVRSFFMLLILLAWQMMRFNEAVQRKRAKAASGLNTQGDEEKAADRRLQQQKRSFAAAFQSQCDQHATRQAYHEWMHTSYDMEMLQLMGFSEAKPRVRSQQWSDEEVAAMLQCLADLATGHEAIHTRDPFYYISHHALLRQKSNEEVKALLKFVEKHYTPQ